MVNLKGNTEDVYTSVQKNASENFITACTSMSTALQDANTAYNNGASTAKNQFQGYFRDIFDTNCAVQNTDRDNLVAALDAVAKGMRQAQAAAQAEQKRREKAREWQKKHAEWQRHIDDKSWFGIPSLVYAQQHSEPKISEKDLKEGTKPSISAPQTKAVSRDTPQPGSASGTTNVSSAISDNLDTFVNTVRGTTGTVTAKISALSNAYNSLESAWTWKNSATLINGMADLITTFSAYNQNNDNDATWLSVISNAFATAGGQGSVVSLSDQALLATLQAAGVSTTRQALLVPQLSLAGMPVSTGFADDPVNTVTGNFVEPEIDIAFMGAASSLACMRMYNSHIAYMQNSGLSDAPSIGVYGIGWSSILDQRMVITDDSVTWIHDDGRQSVFPLNIDNDATRANNENFWARKTTLAETRLIGDFADSGASSDVWLINDNHGTQWVFDTDGQWVAYSSHKSDTVRAVRDDSNRIILLEHARGRSISVNYNALGFVSSLVASDGQIVSYEYEDNYLTVVVSHDGHRSYILGRQKLIEKVISATGVVEVTNTYDDKARVTSQTSQFGRTSRYTYLPGNVTTISDNDGKRANTWIADRYGRTVGLIDSHGNRQSMAYDEHGNLVMSRDRDGDTTIHFYDDRGRETRTVLPTKAQIRYEWDDYDRVTLVSTDNGSTMSYWYANDSDRNPSKIIDAVGGVTLLEWSIDSKLERIIDPTGVTISFEYDQYGDLIGVMNALGDTSRLVRDDAGRIIQAISPLGFATYFEYTDKGMLKTVTQADKHKWNYEYDTHNRLVAITAPDNTITRYEYAPHGELIRVIDPLGRSTEQTFDDLGNVSETILPDGARWAFTRDSLSRLTQIVDPSGSAWNYAYTKTGDVTKITDPTGVSQQSTGNLLHGSVHSLDTQGQVDETVYFDKYGRPVTLTDISGASESVSYDASGKVIEIINAEGGCTKFTRDLSGRIVSVVSPEGRETKYTYDSCGRLATIVTPNGGITSYTYDADSRLIAQVNPAGEKSTYTYDCMNRLVESTIPGVGKSQYSYDAMGRVTYSRDINYGIRKFAYDRAGRLVKATNGVGGVTRYEYDARDRITAITDPLGGVTCREYNNQDKVVKVTDRLGRVTSATYDAAGRQLSQTGPDGVTLKFVYDNGELTETLVDGNLLSRVEMDRVNRTVKLLDYTDPTNTQPTTHTLRFDALGRLTVQEFDDSHTHTQQKSSWSYGGDGQVVSYTPTSCGSRTYQFD
ncbi:DUF6531 domain-containing protein, partial [Alloscardovia venturai]